MNIGCKFNKGRSQPTIAVLLILSLQLPIFIILLTLRLIIFLILLDVCILIFNGTLFKFPEFNASVRLVVLVHSFLLFGFFFAIFSHALSDVFRAGFSSSF
jgi:hypothetical protein